MSRLIFHIDVNSAYLSWEAVYRLQQGEEQDLRLIPSVVGGDEESRHGRAFKGLLDRYFGK